jgi:GNAT superfamily N-acetyltransferase
VYGINHKLPNGKRVHAERAAIENYKNKHGELPEGSVIVTTLSPCTEPMADREGISCTELIDSTPVRRVYAGYRDPSQDHLAHDDFDVVVTNNNKIQHLCKGFADCFLKDTVTEIEAIPSSQYSGGKEALGDYNNINASTLHPLPGGSGFSYAINQGGYMTSVFIVDPNKSSTDAIAVLELERADLPIKGNPLTVETITVDEDYRGRGLAKALYGIVLSIMKRPLIAGHSQTPGGRRNWLSLASIPGVEVKGVIQIDNRSLDVHKRYDGKTSEKYVDKTIHQIMQLGGQFIGKDKYSSYWAFDVVAGKGQLQPAVKNKLSRLYGYDVTNTLIATWTGRAKSINEDQDVDSIGQEFVPYVAKRLGIDKLPDIQLKQQIGTSEHPTFGLFDPDTNSVQVATGGRHVMDVLRTLAHELVHHKQRELDMIQPGDGATGSRIENQANAVAGVLMRDFADQHPDYFGALNELKDPPEQKKSWDDYGQPAVPKLEPKEKVYKNWQHYDDETNKKEPQQNENFADGKNSGRKGLSKRMGVNTHASVSSLRNTAKHSSGEKQRMAHWLANMKAGKAKHNK